VLPGAHDALAPGLAQAASFTQVGVSGFKENVSKIKTFQLWCPNFHEIHGFSTKDSTRTLGWNLLDMIRDVPLPFCIVKPPKVDHVLVASSCFFVPYSDGKSRHF